MRTTLLKAITADYCGTGQPEFTVTGTPLAFATAKEPLAFPSPWSAPVWSFEAMWGPGGATCIDHPRREWAGMTPHEVQIQCARTIPFPSCTTGGREPPPGWWNTRYAITANPLPPPIALPPRPWPFPLPFP